MSLMTAYHALPVWMQELALTAYGWKLRRVRYSGIHQAVLRSLEASQDLSTPAMQDLQQQQLFRVMTHALDYVSAYRARGLFRPKGPEEALDALSRWPILEKAEVQAAGARHIADGLSVNSLLQIHTGGTTGRALAVFASRSVLQTNYAFFERQKLWAGLTYGCRVATFAGRTIVSPQQQRGPFGRRNLSSRQLLLSSYHLSEATLDEYLEELTRFKPQLIDSYPSSLEPLARRVLERGMLSVSPRAIITSSETLFPETRSLFERAFRCKIFDHYGSAEMVALVTQCARGGYHVNPEFGHLELVDDKGNAVPKGVDGEIVATGFINDVMPLVRYRLGDSARWAEQPCVCGSSFPTIESILGRTDDVIITPSGRRIGRIDPIFKAVDSLHEARVVQTTATQVRLEVVASEGFGEQERGALIGELERRLGPQMSIEFAIVDRLPRTKAGKLRSVVNLTTAGTTSKEPSSHS